jgi:hypothetical protein
MLVEASQSKGDVSMKFIFSNNSRFDFETEEHRPAAQCGIYDFALNNASTNSTTRMGLGM